jgi:cytochrome P450
MNSIPAHIPPELVRDFDIFQFVQPDEDIHRAWHQQGATAPPIFFTAHWGGFWVINSAALLEQAFSDSTLFSSADGVEIPPMPPEIPPMLPIDSDDPFHTELRRPLNVALAPKSVNELSIRARELAIELIEKLLPQGRCDFVKDFSLKMPMELFLRIVDLPSSDREYLLGLAGTVLKDSKKENRWAAMTELNGYLEKKMQARRENLGSDLMSKIIQLQPKSHPLSSSEQIGYMTTLLLGGLDTVGGMMAMSARHLAEHPKDRRALIANPSAIPDAIEEIMRRYAISTVARRVTRDAEFGGVALKRGDWIMLPTMVHGLDEKRWDNALEVRFDRRPTDHLSFGSGTHRCPGANLARAELRIFLEEWLKRIPEYSIDPERKVQSESGAVAGLSSLPLIWPIDGGSPFDG